jgi:hypothetical protein
MSLPRSKAYAVTGASVLVALIAGCGGGGGSTPAAGTPAAGITDGSTSCAATANGVPVTASGVAVLGSCEQFENSATPTKVATAFRLPGTDAPVLFNSLSGYAITLPVLTAAQRILTFNDVITAAGGGQALTFGNYAGKTYQIADRASGQADTVYDFANTARSGGSKFIDLNFSRYGLFSRFENRTLGFYGPWAQGNSTVGTLLPSGAVSFTGAMIGVLGPGSTNTARATAVGFSGILSLTVDFTTRQVTNFSLTNIGYSQNGTVNVASVVPLAEVTAVGAGSSVDTTVDPKTISATFSSTGVSPTVGITNARLSGNFYGEPTKALSEIVGNVKFTTVDGRNAIGSFGVRSGASIINP